MQKSNFEKEIEFDEYLRKIFKIEFSGDLHNILKSYYNNNYNKKRWKIYDFINSNRDCKEKEFEKEINDIREFIKTENLNRIKSLIKYLISDLEKDEIMKCDDKIQHLKYIEYLKILEKRIEGDN